MWLDERMKNVAFPVGICSDEMVKGNSIIPTWYSYFQYFNKIYQSNLDWNWNFFNHSLSKRERPVMAESHPLSCFFGELLVLLADMIAQCVQMLTAYQDYFRRPNSSCDPEMSLWSIGFSWKHITNVGVMLRHCSSNKYTTKQSGFRESVVQNIDSLHLTFRPTHTNQ